MLFNWTPGNVPADLAAQVTARCSTAMDRYTLPFLWQIDPTIKQAGQYGSGVLLKVSGRRFLVTSAHTMDEIVVKDLPTYFPGKEDCPAIPFGERTCVMTTLPSSGSRYDDPIDIAVIDVEDIADQFPDAKDFLTVDQLDPDPTDLVGGLYAAWGYPASEFHINAVMLISESRSYGYVGIPAQHKPTPFQQFDPANNIAIVVKDEDGPPPEVHPGGISGGGIWRLSQNERPMADWSSDSLRLVAIEHVWNEKTGTLSGTRVALVLELISQQWPELRSELLHHFPHQDGHFFASFFVLGGGPFVRKGTGEIRPVLADAKAEMDAALWQAEMLKRRGQPDEAMPYLNRALHACSEETSRAALLIRRSQVLFSLGRYKEGLADADLAIATMERRRLKAQLDHALPARGQLLSALGEHARALRDFTRAIEYAREVRCSLGEMNALVDRGGLYETTGRRDLAEKDIEAAVELARAIGDHLGLANALRQRARFVTGAADFARATTDVNEALSIYATTPSAIGEANALHLRGKILACQGLLEGLVDLDRAEALYHRVHNDEGVANCAMARAKLFIHKMEYERALTNLDAAKTLYERMDDDHGRGNVFEFRGDISCLKGDFQSGLRHFRDAAERHRASGVECSLGQSLVQLARAALAAGFRDEAKKAATEGLALAVRTKNDQSAGWATEVLRAVQQ